MRVSITNATFQSSERSLDLLKETVEHVTVDVMDPLIDVARLIACQNDAARTDGSVVWSHAFVSVEGIDIDASLIMRAVSCDPGVTWEGLILAMERETTDLRVLSFFGRRPPLHSVRRGPKRRFA